MNNIDTYNSHHENYQPHVDGLRAIAVLSVVGFHAFLGWISGGFVGVDIFFVISGFLITSTIVNDLRNNKFTFIRFYKKRIRRIFPSLLSVLVLSLAVSWFFLLQQEFREFGKEIAGSTIFLSNIILWTKAGYFNTASETNPLLHLWSLGVEEQYYVLFPFVAILAVKSSRKFLISVLVLLVISFACNIYQVDIDPSGAFYNPAARFWELLSGSMLSVGIRNLQFTPLNLSRPHTVIWSTAASILGIVFVAYGFFNIDNKSVFPGYWALLPVTGACLLIAAGESSLFSKYILSSKIAVWIGLISYPLYLWHWPIFAFLHIFFGFTPDKHIRLVAIAASIALSILTYIYIEKPIRYGKASASAPYWLALGLLALGGVGLWIYHNGGYPDRAVVRNNPPEVISIFDGTSEKFTSCPSIQSSDVIDVLCTSTVGGSEDKIIALWGDSFTDAWLPVFIKLAHFGNYKLVKITALSCPPILEARKTHFDYPGSITYCANGSTQGEVIDYLRRIKPKFVFLISSWISYSDFVNLEYLTDSPVGAANSITTKRTILNHLPQTLKELSSVAHTVVFTGWPYLPEMPYNKRLISPTFQYAARELIVTRDTFNKQNMLFKSIFDSSNAPNLQFYDPSLKICDDSVCHTVLDGVLMYSDSHHISGSGSLMYYDDLSSILRQH